MASASRCSASCRWNLRSKPRNCSKSASKARSADRTATPRTRAKVKTLHMLNIENLHVRVVGRAILKGLSLQVKPGEVHAIMGPNGAGKSTLGNVFKQKTAYEITAGSVTFEGVDLLAMAPEE